MAKTKYEAAVVRFEDFGKKITERLGTFDVEVDAKSYFTEEENFLKIREGVRSIVGSDKDFRPDGFWENDEVRSSFRKSETTALFHELPRWLLGEGERPAYEMISSSLFSTPDNSVESGIGVELYPKGYILYTGTQGTANLFGCPFVHYVRGFRNGLQWGHGKPYVKSIAWWHKKIQEEKSFLCSMHKNRGMLFSLLPTYEMYDERKGLSAKKQANLDTKWVEILNMIEEINTYGDEPADFKSPMPDYVCEEAIRRMRDMSFNESVIRRFENGRLVMGGMEGIPRLLDDHMTKTVKMVEGYGLYPYYTITDRLRFGDDPTAYRIDTVFYVSTEKESWEYERYGTVPGGMDAACFNVNGGIDFGYVGVDMKNGGLVRVVSR